MSDTQRFLFNASGTGVAGTIRAPYHQTIEGQAATCLSIDGGISTAKSERFNFRDIVHFDSAVSLVTGSFIDHENAWETLITTRVEGLNILHVITADAVISRLVSKQVRATPDKSGNLVGPEPEHLPFGSYFVNLRIAGSPIETVPGNMTTSALATFSKASEGQAGEIIQGSLFEKVSATDKGLTVRGNVIDVPGFGRVVLGELFILRNERRLTMIRVELGCPVVGQVSVAYSHGNGTPFPPYSSK